MSKQRRTLALALATIGLFALSPFEVFAQAQYPAKPIRLVVPFAPGGVVDTISRLWAEKVGTGQCMPVPESPIAAQVKVGGESA